VDVAVDGQDDRRRAWWFGAPLLPHDRRLPERGGSVRAAVTSLPARAPRAPPLPTPPPSALGVRGTPSGGCRASLAAAHAAQYARVPNVDRRSLRRAPG